MDIIRKYTDSHMGNCMITDTIYLICIFGVYVVGIIRKYDQDNCGLDFRSKKEFSEMSDAITYFQNLISNKIPR